MFQQQDNGEMAKIPAGQHGNHDANQTAMQVMGMSWQQNGYGNVPIVCDMPTTSFYQYLPIFCQRLNFVTLFFAFVCFFI